MTTIAQDRIERQIALNAPRKRVWQALTNAAEFGEWFRIGLEGSFQAGKSIRGNMKFPGWEHVVVEFTVEKIEPETLFSYRWHPYAIDPDTDYSHEPTTLVEFHLKDDKGGTLLTVIESGFGKLPASRRDEAFRMNENGWKGQLGNLQKYVEG